MTAGGTGVAVGIIVGVGLPVGAETGVTSTGLPQALMQNTKNMVEETKIGLNIESVIGQDYTN